ncbi:MAG: heme exporter protein CcmB [Phycisphaerae bacterium]|nr:heme exporter protein CcmB [Phycisphaerae bacterium]
MSGTRAMAILVAKDLRIEMRAISLAGPLILAIIAACALGLALPAGPLRHGSGALCMAVLVAGLLSIERGMALERQDDALASLLLIPAARAVLYPAKLAACLVHLATISLVVTPLCIVFFSMDLGDSLGRVALAGGLGLVAIAALGTVFSAALAGGASSRLLPAVVAPLLLPVVLLVARGTPSPGVLLAFDAVFVAAGWIGFDALMEEVA